MESEVSGIARRNYSVSPSRGFLSTVSMVYKIYTKEESEYCMLLYNDDKTPSIYIYMVVDRLKLSCL